MKLNKKSNGILLLWKNVIRSLFKNKIEAISIAIIVTIVLTIVNGFSGIIIFLKYDTNKILQTGNSSQIQYLLNGQAKRGEGRLFSGFTNSLFDYYPPQKPTTSASKNGESLYLVDDNTKIISKILTAENKAGINAHFSMRTDRTIENTNGTIFKIIGLPYWFLDDARFNDNSDPTNDKKGLPIPINSFPDPMSLYTNNFHLDINYHNIEWNYLQKNFFNNKDKWDTSSTGMNKSFTDAYSVPTTYTYKNHNGKSITKKSRKLINSPFLLNRADDPSDITSTPGKSHWPRGPNQVLISRKYAQNNNVNIFDFKDPSKINTKNPFFDLQKFDPKSNFNEKLINAAIKENAVVNVSGTNYIVTGYGMAPSFIYPQFSKYNITPNNENQALIFTPNLSYNEYFNNHFYVNRGAIELNTFIYISKSKTDDTLAPLDSQVVNKALAVAKSVYGNISLRTNLPNGLGARTEFSIRLSNVLFSIAIILISIMLIACFFLLALIIKKQINYDAKKIGILKSLGYRPQILATMYIISPIITTIFSLVIGIFVGAMSWLFVTNILGRYFNFYTNKQDIIPLLFNRDSLIVVVSALTILCFIISIAFIITFRLIKIDTKKLIYEKDSVKNSGFILIKKLITPFTIIYTKWKKVFKTKAKNTTFYKNVKYSIITKPKIHNIISQFIISFKFQRGVISKNKSKVLTILTALVVVTLISLITGIIPMVMSQFTNASTKYITPFSSYTNLQQAPTISTSDGYLQNTPSHYHSVFKFNKDKEEVESNILSDGISPSYSTFDFDNFKHDNNNLNLENLIGDKSSNLDPKINLYSESSDIKERIGTAYKNANILKKMYLSLVYYLGFDGKTGVMENPGLGGLTFVQNQLSALKYIDSYSHYIFSQYALLKNDFFSNKENLPQELQNKTINDIKATLMRPWALSKLISSFIGSLLIDNDVQSSAIVYFERFKTVLVYTTKKFTFQQIFKLLNAIANTGLTTEYTVQDLLNCTKSFDTKTYGEYNSYGFSQLLIGTIGVYSPYFIKSKFTSDFTKIDNYYDIVVDQDKAKAPTSYLGKGGIKVEHFSLNNKKAYISFGSTPYSKDKDELYTELSGVIDGKNNSEIWGLNENSRFWNGNQVEKNQLIQDNAYAKINDDTLQDGMSGSSAIPVLVNKSLQITGNFHVGQIIKYSVPRKTRTTITRYDKKDHKTVITRGTVYNEVVYLKVVGFLKQYGPQILYTSRQEANALIFDRNNGTPDIHQQYNWQYNYSDKKAVNTDNDHTTDAFITYETYYSPLPGTNKKYPQSPTAADGLGYYNSVFQERPINSSLYGLELATESTYSFAGGLLFDFSGKNIISGNSIVSGINNFTFLTNFISYILLVVLMVIGMILLITAGKIIIDYSKNTYCLLKAMGYSTTRIMLQSLSFYYIFGVVITIIFALPLFKLLSTQYINFISYILGFGGLHIPQIELSLIFIGIYVGILIIPYSLFWLISFIDIKRLKPKLIVDE